MDCPMTADQPVPVLLLDDIQTIREAVPLLLAGHGFQVDAVATPEQLTSALKAKTYAIVMLDVMLERDPALRRANATPDGLALISVVRTAQPGVRIVLYSDFLTAHMLQEAQERQVDGLLSKNEASDRIAHGLRQVLDPGVISYVSPNLRSPSRRRQTAVETLNPAEMDLLRTFARHPGTRKEIIARLHMPQGTFDATIRNIKLKVGGEFSLLDDPRAPSRDELISNEVLLQWAIEQGIE
jgi:DNA-binding NarL/FixJ family response regulator